MVVFFTVVITHYPSIITVEDLLIMNTQMISMIMEIMMTLHYEHNFDLTSHDFLGRIN